MLFLATVTHSLRWLMAQLSADHVEAYLLSALQLLEEVFRHHSGMVCFVLCCASRYSPSTMPWSQWYVASKATVAMKSMWQDVMYLFAQSCASDSHSHVHEGNQDLLVLGNRKLTGASAAYFFFLYKNNRWTCFAKPTEACHPTPCSCMLVCCFTVFFYCMVETHLSTRLLRQTGVVMLIKPKTNLQMTG